MDCTDAEETFAPVEEFGTQDAVESSDNFQKFIYELFDKNGIINDLRAYLRGHIANVLRSAETGDLPACQKNFTQRLELPFQALNVLVVEYLLSMEFNYTLSVFISEIPLANMVFEFTKNLLNSETEAKVLSLRFEDGDVWSILNCIGLKCNSEQALKILEMYKNEKQPLLCCILKCVSLHQMEEVYISDQSSIQSSDNLNTKKEEPSRLSQKCKHYVYCKSCQYRVARLKERYKMKKANIEKNAKRSNVKKVNVETFMTNVNVLEKTLIDEMFQDLKAVYEAEIEMVKEEQQKKLKHSIASHEIQLQKQRETMEESFRAREVQLSQAVQQRKRFLWGLARSLRAQHAHLARALADVRRHHELLTCKESTLKTRLEDAEVVLKKRGEVMREQISDELVILEGHLENMKKERDSISAERKEMENVKKIDSDIADRDLKKNYDLLKNEMTILRKYIEDVRCEPKCVVDRATNTECGQKFYMNNEIGVQRDKLDANRVVNNLKRSNINFSQSNLGDANDISESTVSSEGDMNVKLGRYRGDNRDGPGDKRGQACDVHTLRQENDKLKCFARQQREYIRVLFNEKDRLQRALSAQSRPRISPSYSTGLRLDPSPRVTFSCGVAGDDRGGRGGEDPPRAVQSPCRDRRVSGTILQQSKMSEPPEEVSVIRPERDVICQRCTRDVREKSPKSMLREAKEKLRNSTKQQVSPQNREKSPTATLREAKLRLRKLEIEAEAVEKSYQDFRRRQSELREERESLAHDRDEMVGKIEKLDVKLKPYEVYENKTYETDQTKYSKETPETMKKDFDKYLKEYNTKFDSNRLRFTNKNSILENVNPIPAAFGDKKDINYLETPLIEFRKLYQVDRIRKNTVDNKVSDYNTEEYSANSKGIDKNPILTNKNEILILQDNNKTYPKQRNFDEQSSKGGKTSPESDENGPKVLDQPEHSTMNEASTPKYQLPDETPKSQTKDSKISSKSFNITNDESKHYSNNVEADSNSTMTNNELNKTSNVKSNLLMVEVENACENIIVPNSVVEEKQDFLLVVETSVESRVSEGEEEHKYPPMSITVSPKNKGGAKAFETPADRSGNTSSDIQNDASDAINREDKKGPSSVEMLLELSKDIAESVSEVGKDADEYLDDFSADVDEYNNPSENGNNSPISLLKTSEDEKFWDS